MCRLSVQLIQFIAIMINITFPAVSRSRAALAIEYEYWKRIRLVHGLAASFVDWENMLSISQGDCINNKSHKFAAATERTA